MKADIYLHKTSNLFLENLLLKFAVVVMGIAVVLGSWFTHSTVRDQKVIIVPPGLNAKIEVGGSVADENYLRLFSRYVIDLFLTYTPANARKQFEEILTVTHPTVYADMKGQLYDLVENIESAGITSAFHIEEVKSISGKKGRALEVKGAVRQFYKDTMVGDIRKTFIVRYRIDSGRFSITSIKEKTL